MIVKAGAACRDITPDAGLEMAGFAARTGTATGAHDPLTVRALVIEDTAIVIADVIGIDANMSARIIARTSAATHVIVMATHTHGGPVSMPGRLGFAHDPHYLEKLEDICVSAIEAAVKSTVPARVSFAMASNRTVGKNRRHIDGPVDTCLPVLMIADNTNQPLAVLGAVGCHPVVLNAANREWTADYIHGLRTALETRWPGSIAMVAMACAGDVNTGHGALDPNLSAHDDNRSFGAAERIGKEIADATDVALSPLANTGTGFARRAVDLGFTTHDSAEIAQWEAAWRAEKSNAAPARAALLDHWLDWCSRAGNRQVGHYRASVSAFRLGDVGLLALPGEIFAATGLAIRDRWKAPLIIATCADDNPGYIPPRHAYAEGGYEVDEAHRYYRMPAAFAPGSAEKLEDAAIAALNEAWGRT